MTERPRILIIKLGALGDFIQAMGPIAAIRKHHPQAQITLLTTRPFENFAKACGYIDEVWIDDKPKLINISSWLNLKKKLNAANFSRVYDLQNNDRTAFYFRLFKQKPEWVGTAAGASHRNNSPARIAGHAFDGHVQTLALAGITNIRIDTLDWLQASITAFPLRKPYVLLIPGSAPQHPQKRWPAAHYARLAVILSQDGYQPVILGTDTESEIATEILKSAPEALDLTGQTTLAEVASLARNAAAAIGNDTGPMHLIAATACPCLVLFSNFSNPQRHAPMGQNVQVIQKNNLADLKAEDVLEKFTPREKPAAYIATLH